MKMNITDMRAILSVLNLAAVVSLAVLAFFCAKELTSTQVALLTVLITALTSGLKSSYAYVFDGVPDGNTKTFPQPTSVTAEVKK